MPDFTLDTLFTGDLETAWIADADSGGTRTGALALLERSLAEFRRERDDRLTSSVIPPRYAAATMTHPKIMEWAAETARNSLMPHPIRTGPSVILFGPPGRGKTHQVYGARRAFHDLGISVSWTIVTAADLHGTIRRFDGTDATDYATAQLLVIDDLGAGNHTQFNDDTLYRIVNHRYEAMLPTMLTTNLAPTEVKGVFGERIEARLREMCGYAAVWAQTDQDWRAK